MRKIYHLGLHKTGSTSLQHYLHRNQQRLAAAGVLYPPVTPQGLARFEDAAAGRPLPAPVLNDYMGHNGLAYRMIAESIASHPLPKVHEPMPAAEAVLAQIKAQSALLGTDTLIFCSEDLARASLMVPQVPARFAQAFGTDDVTLIAALRRPDQAIAAWQTQRLRFGHPFGALSDDPPEAWLGSIHLEYRAALAPWLDAFPGADLRLLTYDDLRAQGGSVEGFGALAQLDLPPGMVVPANSNPGLPHALLEVARRGICALPHGPGRAWLTYLQQAAPRLDLPANDQAELFAPETRQVLARAFEDIHAWLCQVTGRWPFFDDLADMATSPPLPAREVTRAVLPALRADAAEHLENPVLETFLNEIRL